MDPIQQSKEAVAKSREFRLKQTIPGLSQEEQDQLIATVHPDSKSSSYRELLVGPNAGERTVHEVAMSSGPISSACPKMS